MKKCVFISNSTERSFLQRVRIGRNMQSAVLARGILSVRPSVCLSVRPSRSGIVSR